MSHTPRTTTTWGRRRRRLRRRRRADCDHVVNHGAIWHVLVGSLARSELASKPRAARSPDLGASARVGTMTTMSVAQAPDQRMLAELSENQRRQAMARWDVLQPCLSEGVPLTRAAAASGVPVRTARRWLAAYRAGGLAGLARAPRADRATRRFPPELVGLIEGLYLRQPAPSVATVHRTAATVAAAQGWPIPSYTTVWDIVGFQSVRGVFPHTAYR